MGCHSSKQKPMDHPTSDDAKAISISDTDAYVNPLVCRNDNIKVDVAAEDNDEDCSMTGTLSQERNTSQPLRHSKALVLEYSVGTGPSESVCTMPVLAINQLSNSTTPCTINEVKVEVGQKPEASGKSVEGLEGSQGVAGMSRVATVEKAGSWGHSKVGYVEATGAYMEPRVDKKEGTLWWEGPSTRKMGTGMEAVETTEEEAAVDVVEAVAAAVEVVKVMKAVEAVEAAEAVEACASPRLIDPTWHSDVKRPRHDFPHRSMLPTSEGPAGAGTSGAEPRCRPCT